MRASVVVMLAAALMACVCCADEWSAKYQSTRLPVLPTKKRAVANQLISIDGIHLVNLKRRPDRLFKFFSDSGLNQSQVQVSEWLARFSYQEGEAIERWHRYLLSMQCLYMHRCGLLIPYSETTMTRSTRRLTAVK